MRWIRIKGNSPKAWEIFLVRVIFLWLLSHLSSHPFAWTQVSVTLCWRKLGLDGRQIASTDTGNIHSQCFTPLSTLSQVQSWLVSPKSRDAVSACQDTSRHQAPVIRTIHKNPCSLCSQWREKTLWSWNVSDFIGHFSELLDTLLSVFPCLWVTECLIPRLD